MSQTARVADHGAQDCNQQLSQAQPKPYTDTITQTYLCQEIADFGPQNVHFGVRFFLQSFYNWTLDKPKRIGDTDSMEDTEMTKAIYSDNLKMRAVFLRAAGNFWSVSTWNENERRWVTRSQVPQQNTGTRIYAHCVSGSIQRLAGRAARGLTTPPGHSGKPQGGCEMAKQGYKKGDRVNIFFDALTEPGSMQRQSSRRYSTRTTVYMREQGCNCC